MSKIVLDKNFNLWQLEHPTIRVPCNHSISLHAACWNQQWIGTGLLSGLKTLVCYINIVNYGETEDLASGSD